MSLVAALAAGAVNGLLDGVGGQNSESDGNAGLQLHRSQSAGGLIGHMIEVRRFSANYRAQGDDGVVSFERGERFGGDGEFPGSRDLYDFDVFGFRARTLEGVFGGGEQTVSDEAVEARDHDGEFQTAGVEISFDRFGHMG